MTKFEEKHVHKFYEESSQEFSNTRYKMWPKIAEFYSKYVKPTDTILDAGCGNGRNTLFPNRTVSVDYSKRLLEISKDKGKGAAYLRHDLADPLPLRKNSVDVAISIAVIHHLSTIDRRKAAMRALLEPVRKGGYVLLYVWSETPNTKPSKLIGVSSVANTSLEDAIEKPTPNDVFLGWKNTNRLERYYHLFTENELEELVPGEEAAILESGKDHGNYFIVCQKSGPDGHS